jgi:uncharacterized protein YqeY
MKEQIQKLMNEARRLKLEDALTVYRTILAEIQDREYKKGEELTTDQILDIIEQEKKLYDESAKAFAEAGNISETFACKSKSQICSKFLPEKLDESEYDKVVNAAIISVGADSIGHKGKIMGFIAKKYGKSVDMKAIGAIVESKLS